MKPAGHALDIAAVGLGQAGGNLAAEFARRGYRAIALNTAHTDLASLDADGVYPEMPEGRRLYIGLEGYDGAGADPIYGRQCIATHKERIRIAVLEEAAAADVLVLACGLGGGTGSALTELIGVLEEDGIPMIALMTIPTDGESAIVKVNAVRAVNEILAARLFGWIFIDNARIAELNPNVAIVEYHRGINSRIVAPIDEWNRLNARKELKPIRSFDGEDFRKLLLPGGIIDYANATLPVLTVDGVLGFVRRALEESELMPSGFDVGRIAHLGLVIEASEATLEKTPHAVFEGISSRLKADTMGGAIHHGIYRGAPGSPTIVRLIAATQALPHRIRSLLGDAKREGMILSAKVDEQLPDLELGDLLSFEPYRTHTRPSERPRPSTRPRRHEADDAPSPEESDVAERGMEGALDRARSVDRRARHRRRVPPGRATTAQPSPHKLEDGDEDDSEAGTDSYELGSELARDPAPPSAGQFATEAPRDERGAVIPGVDASQVPNPAAYDRMVAEYLRADSARARQRIVRRLEGDSLSEHTLVRYYAVEAMAKLDAKVFGNALLLATRDENESVRTIAKRALEG